MFYEKLAEAKQKKPTRLQKAGQGLRAFAPGIAGIPMLGGGLHMLADPQSNTLGKTTGGALALGGGALLYKGVKDALRVKRKNQELKKEAKLSPYQKSYLASAAGMGGLGALGGAVFQHGKAMRGADFDKLSPAEKKKRVRRKRLIGAAGGAARGLAMNHILMNAMLPSASRGKDLAHIAGGTALLGLGGGLADYHRLDESARKALKPKQPGESDIAYNARIKGERIGDAVGHGIGSIGMGLLAAKGRDVIDSAVQFDPDVRRSGSFRDAFNDFVNNAGKRRSGGYGGGRYGGGRTGSGSTGGGRAGGGSSGTGGSSANYGSSFHGAQAAGADFGQYADGMDDLQDQLNKARGDKKAAAALRVKLKKAYRRASMKHHPDRGGDAEKFKRMKEAYESMEEFLEKNSMYLRLYAKHNFYEKVAAAKWRRSNR